MEIDTMSTSNDDTINATTTTTNTNHPSSLSSSTSSSPILVSLPTTVCDDDNNDDDEDDNKYYVDSNMESNINDGNYNNTVDTATMYDPLLVRQNDGNNDNLHSDDIGNGMGCYQINQNEELSIMHPTTTTTASNRYDSRSCNRHIIVGVLHQRIMMHIRSFVSILLVHHPTFRSNKNNISISNVVQSVLSFYTQLISNSPSNQDKIIKLIQYTLYILSITINSTTTTTNQKQRSCTTLISKWMYKLYTELTWARYILRMIQLPSIVHATINQTWTVQAKNTMTATATTTTDTNTTTTTGTTNAKSSSSVTGNTTNPMYSKYYKKLVEYINHYFSYSNNITPEQRQQLYNIFGKVLTYSMVWYYPTECIAYLLWMKPSFDNEISQQQQQQSEVVTTSDISTMSSSPVTTELICSSRISTITPPTPMILTKYRMLFSSIYKFYTTTNGTTTVHTTNKHYYDNDHDDNVVLQKKKQNMLTTVLWSKPSQMMTQLLSIRPETWSYLSCRGWLVYVITELIQSYIQYKELVLVQQQQQQQKQQQMDNDDDIDSKNKKHEQDQVLQNHQYQKNQIVLQCIRNVLYIIPCMTWSLPQWDTNPIVSNYHVNTLLWLESIVSFVQMIYTQQHINKKI